MRFPRVLSLFPLQYVTLYFPPPKNHAQKLNLFYIPCSCQGAEKKNCLLFLLKICEILTQNGFLKMPPIQYNSLECDVCTNGEENRSIGIHGSKFCILGFSI